MNNFLKLSLRNLWKNKVFTIINILGLSLGMAICIVIYLIVKYEYSFDQFHTKKDQIYRIAMETKNASGWHKSASVPQPAGPEISEYTGQLTTTILWMGELQVRFDENPVFQDNIMFADSSFFDVFDYEVLIGDPLKDLKNENLVYLTESVAKEWYGTTDKALGKTIWVDGKLEVDVAGILKDVPANSHLPFEIIISYPSVTREVVGGFDIDNWGTTLGGYAYMLMDENQNPEIITSQLTEFIKTNFDQEDQEDTRLHIQSLNDIHFMDDYPTNNLVAPVSSNYLMLLSLVAIFILTIACINFINLTTALSVKRAKEVGIKKTLGASRKQLVFHFLIETLLISSVSALIALGVIERSLPQLNSFLDKEIELSVLTNPQVFLFVGILVLIVAFLSGIYPSFILSNYQPTKVLKSQVLRGNKSSISLRRVLVILQFSVAQFLIIGSIIISQQLKYFSNKPLGFDKDAIITAELYERDSLKQQRLKTLLMNNSAISGVSLGLGVPISNNSVGTSFQNIDDGEDNWYRCRFKAADTDYPNIFDLDIIAGRWYSSEESNLIKPKIVVNETLVKKMGLSNPQDAVNTDIRLGLSFHEDSDQTATIVGVVKDFHTRSFHHEIQPLVIFEAPPVYYEAGIKISGDIDNALAGIESVWKEVYPEYAFDYNFFDESLAALYNEEKRTYKLNQAATYTAILIACMGLYGLISFIAVQKTKEVGIRKALGASVSSIMFQINKEFLALLVISFIVAAPLSWLFTQQWLSNFAYQVQPTPLIVFSGLIINILVAFITVSYQSIKAAKTNPVKALKYE